MTLPKVRNSNATHFGEIIHRLRNERRWTVRELAEKASVNYRHMLILDRGNNFPTLQTLFNLANAFGVKASEIVAEVEAAGVSIKVFQ